MSVGTVSRTDAMGVAQPVSFDVSTPTARAKLLVTLKSHANGFTPDEQRSYDAFRDALTRVARGEQPAPDLQAYADTLGRFLGVAEVVIGTKAEAVAPVIAQPARESLVDFSMQTASTPVPVKNPTAPLSTVTFSRTRRGPDIERALAEASEVRTSAPGAVTIIEEKSAGTTASVPEVVLVMEKKEAASSVLPESEIKTQRSLTDDVEQINDSLNEFAHGTAFRWLADAATGYRAYLSELLELRGLLASPGTAIEDANALCLRINNLRTMADMVRKNVGGELTQSVKLNAIPVEQKEPVAEIVPPAQAPEPSVAPADVQENIPVAPVAAHDVRLTHEEVTISPALGPLNVEPIREMGSEVAEGVGAGNALGAETFGELTAPAGEPAVAERIEDVEEIHMRRDDGAPHGVQAPEPLLEDGEPESALMEKVSPPDSPLLEPLHTRAIDAGLNDLLTHWLGTTGFLGFGDSGVKHPDWLLMKDVFVEDVLHGDGVIPPGLRPELFDNLGQNIRSWRSAYALHPIDGELVEHYVRRVVDVSIPKQK